MESTLILMLNPSMVPKEKRLGKIDILNNKGRTVADELL